MLSQVETGKALLRGSREERSVVAVTPAVVRAGDASVTPAGALEQTRATVATAGAQRPNAPAPLAQHDHAVGAQLEGHVVSGVPDLADVAGDLPARLEQPLALEAGRFRVGVHPRRAPPRHQAGSPRAIGAAADSATWRAGVARMAEFPEGGIYARIIVAQ